MKFPTLFGRIPKHQKFNFEPRFYDAEKEEREARERRLNQQMENERTGSVDGYQERIKGSFQSSRKRSQTSSSELQATLIRIGLLLLMVVLLIGFLEWGAKALYGAFIILPVYLWLRFRK